LHPRPVPCAKEVRSVAHSDLELSREYTLQRHTLVAQLRAVARQTSMRVSEPVLQVIGRIPRERFVARDIRAQAYEDRAQPIGLGQTLSQPAMVAWMTTLLGLTGDESVLEIGTGSGYQTAVLAELLPRGRVISIERLDMHARRARRRLHALGIDNVRVIAGDGSIGYAQEAPYDRVLVTAGAPQIPGTLIDQLAPGGILVAPIGTREMQELVTVHVAADGGHSVVNHGRCAFVPLVGAEGWEEE
jgi:protein-L-isoaspartate(D-aspartate) O-methyltransferase